MKTNIMGKYKWYLIAIIAAVLIMSIGLSFCVWDTTSIDINGKMNGGTSNYKPYDLVGDNFKDDNGTAGANNIVNVGDIVTFGKYYQSANEVDKSALEWRVVDIRTENSKPIMYLLSEKVLAFGSFCGTGYYFDENGAGVVTNISARSQKYNESTLKAWLNSEDRSADKGVGFSTNPEGTHVVFKGFYNEAFSEIEKNLIAPRKLLGATGYDYTGSPEKRYEDMPSEKVWAPSLTEMYGAIQVIENHGTASYGPYNNDNKLDKQFSYFVGKGNNLKAAKSTLFSTNKSANGLANFSQPGLIHPLNLVTEKYDVEEFVEWLTRSPAPTNPSTLRVSPKGEISGNPHYASFGNSRGVRPAICIER